MTSQVTLKAKLLLQDRNSLAFPLSSASADRPTQEAASTSTTAHTLKPNASPRES